MDATIRTYTYFLDTKYRTGGTNYQPEFSLANIPSLSSPDNYFEVQLISAEIPYSFSSVSQPNNTVNYTMLLNGITTSGVITIVPGNYSITTLLTAFSNAITSITGTSSTTPKPNFTYNAATGYSTLALSNTASSPLFQFTIFWTTSDILAETLGFFYTANTYLQASGGSDQSTQNVSPNNVNVSPVTSMCLRSDSLSQDPDQVECLVEPVFTQSNIICKIPVQTPANSWLYYENNSFAVRVRNAHIDVLQFYLTSQTYDALSFDGVHWRITIQIRERRPANVLTRDLAAMQELERATKQMRDLELQRTQMVDELQRKTKKLRTLAPS